jgi:DNA-binding NarL/FixJ family response regulator
MNPTINVIIADDHPLFRSALKGTLQAQFSQTKLLEAEDIASLQTTVERHPNTHLILLDLHMPGAEGFSALVFLIAHYPHIPVMIVSAHEEAEIIQRAIQHGASGFLPKSSSVEEMTQAINTVLGGGIWTPKTLETASTQSIDEAKIAKALGTLTPQQFRVASMVSQGMLNKQIAYELNVTEATIKAHMTEILRKLELNSRTQVVKVMSHLSIQPVDDSSTFQ